MEKVLLDFLVFLLSVLLTVFSPYCTAFAYLFAIALLASGQSASLTVTLSGQIISEGFIQWRTTPWKRRLITRTIGIVPSVVIAATVGRDGLDVLLIGSQVALSIVSLNVCQHDARILLLADECRSCRFYLL